MNNLTLSAVAVVCVANSASAWACSAPDLNAPTEIANVASSVPAKDVPEGAIQLKVKALTVQEFHTALDVGKISLAVKEVANGYFHGPTVLLNITNADQCITWFDQPFGDFFITVVPLIYSDGNSVFDEHGKQEYGSLFYSIREFYSSPPDLIEQEQSAEFAKYSATQNYSFYDPVRLSCLYDESDHSSNWTTEGWRQCVGTGEYVALNCEQQGAAKLVCDQFDINSSRPPELRRGHNLRSHYRMLISALLLPFAIAGGMGLFLLGRKLRTP